MTQRTIEITSPVFVNKSDLNSPEDLNRLFVNQQPLALEIGCGTGHFIAEMAARHPEINFLAIDIYNKGCLKTCKKIDLLGLNNVRVMRIEACHLIANFLLKQSLSAVYINCPDPWPKKKHRYRRLVNQTFLQSLLHYLQPDADFYFSTDFADYAEQVADLIPNASGYRNALETPFVTNFPDYPTSKYMQRFLDRGLPIHFIHLQRCKNINFETLPKPELKSGFRSSFGDRHHD
jgi:tRNA (guanine-N7-)-methyltransferase